MLSAGARPPQLIMLQAPCSIPRQASRIVCCELPFPQSAAADCLSFLPLLLLGPCCCPQSPLGRAGHTMCLLLLLLQAHDSAAEQFKQLERRDTQCQEDQKHLRQKVKKAAAKLDSDNAAATVRLSCD